MSQEDELAEGVGEGLQTARNMGHLESLRLSLRNYRDLVGMTLGVAVAIDLLFIGLGLGAAMQATGPLQWAGYGLAGIGILGLVEKVLKRVVA